MMSISCFIKCVLNKKKSYKKILVSYAKGKFVPITDVPDPIFSEKMMGDGVAILVMEIPFMHLVMRKLQW